MASQSRAQPIPRRRKPAPSPSFFFSTRPQRPAYSTATTMTADEAPQQPRLQLAQMLADLSDLTVAVSSFSFPPPPPPCLFCIPLTRGAAPRPARQDPAAARALLAAATPPTPTPPPLSPDEDLGRASALLRFCAERDRLALQDGAGLARPRADVAAVEARYASLKAARVVDGSGGPASDEQRRA